MCRSSLVLPLFLICAATPALAGVIVVGSGIGRECYEQTLLARPLMRSFRALEICDKAVNEYEVSAHDRAAAFVNRADILLKMQKYLEAVADSEKAITLDPCIGAAHLNRGAGMIGLERYNDALVSLNQAMDLGGDNLQLIYFDRGMAKENLGDVKGAYYDYRKAAELDPSFQLAIQQLSRFAVTTR